MNRKGEELGVMAFMAMFIGIITGLILFQAIQPFISTMRDTATAENVTYTLLNSSDDVYITTDLEGQELLSTPCVTNSSVVGLCLGSDNYTIDEGVSTTTGLKTIQFTWAEASTDSGVEDMNISYDYGVDGYVDNSAGRSMVGLISIFAALAIAVFALSPTLRSGIIDRFGK